MMKNRLHYFTAFVMDIGEKNGFYMKLFDETRPSEYYMHIKLKLFSYSHVVLPQQFYRTSSRRIAHFQKQNKIADF